jgi:tripartite ATP-independent transporter DctP family solute receptor
VLVVAAFSLAACDNGSDDDAPVEWRFAIEETRGSVQDAYAQRFKELVESRSGGKIQVAVYPYGTLGTSDQVTELLRMGTIQFAMASPGHLGTLMPEIQVLLLHFVLSDDDRVNQMVLSDPELRSQFDVLYQEKGLKLLSIFSEGWMVWTTKDLIRTPKDFEGVKMRVMTSPLLLAAYAAYGASPTPLPYGEVYSALQLNMIDGQVNPVFAIQEMSFYEVSDYMIFARHAPFIATAVTNQEFFEELPPDQRQMVLEIIEELQGYIHETQRQFNAERMEIIRTNKPGLQIIPQLSAAERERFQEASLGVRDIYLRMAGPRGKALLDNLLSKVKATELLVSE